MSIPNCSLSLLSSLPPSNHKFAFYVCESVSVLWISSFASFFLDSTYKQYHVILMTFVFLCHLFSVTISGSTRVAAHGVLSAFSVTERYPTLYLHCVVSLHSCLWTSSLLPCHLAVAHSTVTNIGVHASFGPCLSLHVCPGVGLLDHMLVPS